MAKNTICLWYDKDAEAAARFYAETFPDSAVGAVHRAPSDYPSGKQGDVLTVEFTVAGIPCLGRDAELARAARDDDDLARADDEIVGLAELLVAVPGNEQEGPQRAAHAGFFRWRPLRLQWATRVPSWL